MLRPALAMASKDLRLTLSAGQGLSQAVLLGLLLIFVFSLALPTGQAMPPQGAAAVFWLSTAFAQVLIYNALYSLEESQGARLGLLLSPAPPASIWLGKALAGAALLLVTQLVFAPAAVAFLNQDVKGSLALGLAALAAVDLGLAILGSLLGALAQGQAGRESLLSVVLFPLLVPLLLAGIKVGAAVLAGAAPGANPAEAQQWLGLAAAFDAVYGGAGLILFPFVFSGEE